MLRTADLLNPHGAFVTTLRRSGLPWRRSSATEVAWSLLMRVLPPLVDHSFIWTHSSLVEIPSREDPVR
jgi:hypothetical protein